MTKTFPKAHFKIRSQLHQLEQRTTWRQTIHIQIRKESKQRNDDVWHDNDDNEKHTLSRFQNCSSNGYAK